MFSNTVSVLALATFVAQATAHGYVRTWTLDGVDYNGYSRSDGSPSSDAIGWSFTTPDEGPEMDLTSPDFICRKQGKAAQSFGTIAAGGQAGFYWTSDDKERNPDGWSQGHRGPVITYIAPYNEDKTQLKWTKIAEEGVEGPANTQGTWATDKMRANGGVATATIPSSIAPGKYVLRHEIIALHRAHLSEPEFYMQCGNVEVTGSGTDTLSGSGVSASELYSTADTQIFGFSVYDNRGDTWVVPGPPLYSGAGSTPATGTGNNNGPTTPSNPTPTNPEDPTMSILPVDEPEVSILPIEVPTTTTRAAVAPAPANTGSGYSNGQWWGWRPRGGSRY